MNILILSYLFPPVANPQAMLSARLAKYLKRAGHDVTVIAGTEVDSYGSTHGTDNGLVEDLCGVDVLYVKDTTHAGMLNKVKNLLVYHENYSYWVRNVLKIALPLCKRKNIEMIYSLSAPMASNIAGMKIKLRTSLPWIAHFSDPTYLALNLKFKSPLRTYLTYKDENDLLNIANGITFVNDDTLLKTTESCKESRKKCIVLPHFFDPDYYVEKEPNHLCGSKLIFSYIGSLYGGRNPFGVVDAFKCLIDRRLISPDSFELHLIGAIDENIWSVLSESSFPWLIVHGPVSYRKSIKLMQESNYLLLIDMPGSNNMYTPSKLIDYLAAEVPIIGITPGQSNSAKIINKLDYYVVEPGDVQELSHLLHTLIATPHVGISEQHKSFSETFRADTVVNQLIAFMDTLMVKRSP